MHDLIGSFPFEIDARVPIQLGRESISSSVVAVSELVKNAYDADAELVKVQFSGLDTTSASMVVQDDGDGMDENTLANYWLRIGTDFKTETLRSSGKKRVLTGAKGLGRLGIDRLCSELVLQTKCEGMDHVLELNVQWSRYEEKGKALSDIQHDLYKVSLPVVDDFGKAFEDADSKGTRLVMKGLKDEWSEDFLAELRQELSLLISPFGGVNDFNVALKIEDVEHEEILSSTNLLDAAEWVLEVNLDEENAVSLELQSGKHGEKYAEGPYDWADWIKTQGKKPTCGPFSFLMYFVPKDSSVLKALKFSVKDRAEFMAANQGIRIYRDSFRVRPYGEPSGRGDWLDLGLRRSKRPEGITQKGWTVGPHQVVGAVFIGRAENPQLLDQTNREGIVEGQAFADLRAAIHRAIDYFESTAHHSAVQRKERSESEKAKDTADEAASTAREELDRLQAQFAEAADIIDGEAIPEPLRDAFSKVKEATGSADAAIRAAEALDSIRVQEVEELQHEKDTMANLASLGILTVCFGHEAKEYATLGARNALRLKENFEKGHLELLPPYDGRFADDLDIIVESTEFIRNFASLALGNVRPDKRRRTNIDLSTVISTIFQTLSLSLERQNITPDLSGVPDACPPIRAFRIDWESIVLNLTTNAITALKSVAAEDRQILVRIDEIGDDLALTFADSGVGIEAGTETHIFDPMFSTKRNHKGLVEGTGMGLAIVQTFVADHSGGQIEVTSPGRLGGAEFVLRVPKAVKGGKADGK